MSKDKLPRISYNEKELNDSFFIIQFLTQKFDKDLSIHLTHTQKAVSRAILKLIEESLSWYDYNNIRIESLNKILIIED